MKDECFLLAIPFGMHYIIRQRIRNSRKINIDDHIKIQIENIADLCNWSAKKMITPERCTKGRIFDVTVQFYQLREWRIHLEYDSEVVYFVKREDDELIKHFAGHRGDSPLDVVNEFYEYAKDLIEDGFVCITNSEMEDF